MEVSLVGGVPGPLSTTDKCRPSCPALLCVLQELVEDPGWAQVPVPSAVYCPPLALLLLPRKWPNLISERCACPARAPMDPRNWSLSLRAWPSQPGVRAGAGQ